MKTIRIIENLTDYSEITYGVAGIPMNIGAVENLKVYANNTVYLNGKKNILSSEDIDTIETALCEIFITRVINNQKGSKDQIFRTTGYANRVEYVSYKIGKFSFHENRISLNKDNEVRSILNQLNVEVVDR